MTSSAPAEIVPRLSAMLAGFRRRLRVRALLMSACAAIAAGLIMLLLARVATQLTSLPVAPETLAALAAGVVGLIGLALTALRVPPLDVVARNAETQLALDERLTSALEVAADWPAGNNVITSALINEVEEKAAGFDVARLVPLRSRALTATAIAALVAGVGALLVPAAANVPQAGVGIEGEAPAAGGEQAKIDDSEIRQLADLVRKDGDRRNNELLQAIANSLEKLAQQAASGQPQQEVSDELRQLLEMAKQAYGNSQPAWMPEDINDTAALDKGLQAEEAKANSPQGVNVDYEASYEMGYYGAQENSGKKRDSFTPDELNNLGMSQGDGGDLKVDPNFGEGQQGPANPSLPFEAKPLETDAEVIATPAGAAADSSKGDAQMAGGGEEGMSAEALAAAEYRADSDMSIRSDKPEAEGKRIRLELPPDAQASEAGDANLGPGERSRAETDAVNRSLVDARARGLVARYFARKQV